MTCPALHLDGSSGLAGALAAIDCRTGAATGEAFGRLFGSQGVLLPALTILLTLFVGIYGIGLLTGRARIGVAALTPRMLSLGLVLTFATSWMAYSQTVWTLATGAPDQIAGILAGTHGSATTAFAQSLDRIFAAISDAAQAAAKPAEAAPAGSTVPPPPVAPLVGGFSAATVLGLSAMMLLLGTVGVLVTAKIALAALLAVGPVFIVMALFAATRGLFEGWLKAVALFALVPLFATLIGGGAIAVIEPVARSIQMAGGTPPPAAVMGLFLAASVYCALMLIVVKTAATIVSGWRIPGGPARARGGGDSAAAAPAAPAAAPPAPAGPAAVAPMVAAGASDRVRAIVSGLPAVANDVAAAGAPAGGGTRRIVVTAPTPGEMPASYAPSRRPEGVGSRFRAPPKSLSKDHVS